MEEVSEVILWGGYFDLVNCGLDMEFFYSSYLVSYVECDVVELINWFNLDIFQCFLCIVVICVGQIVNYSKMVNVIGVNLKIIQVWLGILE